MSEETNLIAIAALELEVAQLRDGQKKLREQMADMVMIIKTYYMGHTHQEALLCDDEESHRVMETN